MALLWTWPVPPCPGDAAASAARPPNARTRMRIPRTARARTDLGDLRCADNLRCAPPTGPLEGVPRHNELRISIGGGPLLTTWTSGPLGDRSYSSAGAGIWPLGNSGRVSRTCPGTCPTDKHAANVTPARAEPALTCIPACSAVTLVTAIGFGGRLLDRRPAFFERVHANCAAPSLSSR